MKHKVEFILGLSGRVLGIITGILIIKTDLFKAVANNKKEALLIGMFVILCSVFAIIASLFIEIRPKEAGFTFIVSGAWDYSLLHFFMLFNLFYYSLQGSWLLLKLIRINNVLS